jgi:iron transport multicopper oxidase
MPIGLTVDMLQWLVAVLALTPFAFAATVTYDWTIDWVNVAPDGFVRPVIGINGAWPCPPIEATVGDTVVVQVYNNLGNQSTGLHFHGLNQHGTQVMDGPSGVTQCPVPPGSNFTYTFEVVSRSQFSRQKLICVYRSTSQALIGTILTTKGNTPMG